MRTLSSHFIQSERKLVAQKKAMLPFHAGESRYQMALDRDRNFREMILAAFALALFAASGFGQMANFAGPARTALFCIAAAGFSLRVIALRFASQDTGTSLVDGPPTRLIAVCVAGSGVLGSILSGTNGLQSILAVFGCIAVLLLLTAKQVLRTTVYAALGLSLVTLALWSFGFSDSGFTITGAALGFVAGSFAVCVSLFSNRNQSTAMQPSLILTSYAAYGWIILTTSIVLRTPWSFPVVLAACFLFAILERFVSIRSAFAPIVILLVLLHLSGFIGAGEDQSRLIGPHLTTLLLEFCLLGMAGYRHAIAALNRFPLATYRSSPQCLVPTLDHAWDHPVKIDAA